MCVRMRVCRMGGDVAKGVHKEGEAKRERKEGGRRTRRKTKSEEEEAPTVMLFVVDDDDDDVAMYLYVDKCGFMPFC